MWQDDYILNTKTRVKVEASAMANKDEEESQRRQDERSKEMAKNDEGRV